MPTSYEFYQKNLVESDVTLPRCIDRKMLWMLCLGKESGVDHLPRQRPELSCHHHHVKTLNKSADYENSFLFQGWSCSCTAKKECTPSRLPIPRPHAVIFALFPSRRETWFPHWMNNSNFRPIHVGTSEAKPLRIHGTLNLIGPGLSVGWLFHLSWAGETSWLKRSPLPVLSAEAGYHPVWRPRTWPRQLRPIALTQSVRRVASSKAATQPIMTPRIHWCYLLSR